MEMSTMRLHTLQNCISLAEAVPTDAGNYRVIGELLIELRHLAKAEENAK
jgi:hypothetical protein